MPPSSPPDPSSIRAPHPLARLLAERLGGEGRILDFATGSGRNRAALERAGFEVTAVDDEAAAGSSLRPVAGGPFRAAVSTHGFLHGTADEAIARVRAVAAALEPGGWVYATFGSSRDARFGKGTRLGPQTYAPAEGDERGVPHAFFDEAQLRGALAGVLEIESLEERGVDGIAGAWAHEQRPLEAAVHWFVVARRPGQ